MNDRATLDKIDQKILKLLMENARTPYLEIARECGISGAAIHQRIKKLEDSGIIEGTRLLVKPRALGLNVCAFVNLKLSQSNIVVSVVEELKKMAEVVECHFVVGDYSLLIKVFCLDNDHLMDLLINRILNISGVSETSSCISLAQTIEREIPVLDVDKKKL